MSNSTAATLLGYALQLAKVTDTEVSGIPGCGTTALVRIVDRENRLFVEAPYETNQSGWDFMIEETGFTVQTVTTTTGALTAASTTVPVTSTAPFNVINGQLTGAGVIFTSNISDPFIYTAVSTTTGAGNLTGASGLSMAHASGDSIYALYQLPSTFGQPRPEIGRGDGLTIDNIPYFYGGTGVPWGYNYSIFYDATNDVSYLWLPRDITGTAQFRYNKAATVITSDTQTVDVPVAAEEYIIQKVAAHILRVLSKDVSKVIDCESQALSILNGFFAKRSKTRRVRLSRGPIRSPSTPGMAGYMDSAGNIYPGGYFS